MITYGREKLASVSAVPIPIAVSAVDTAVTDEKMREWIASVDSIVDDASGVEAWFDEVTYFTNVLLRHLRQAKRDMKARDGEEGDVAGGGSASAGDVSGSHDAMDSDEE